LLAALLCAGVIIGSDSGETGGAAVRIAASTSLLECAVYDLLGNEPGIEVTTLIPPGNCPGHFDVSPRTATRLKNADLLLHHDYQEALARKLKGLSGERLMVASFKTPGSFLIPANYLLLLQEVKSVLQTRYPELGERLERNLSVAKKRLRKLAEKLDQHPSAWSDTPVIVASHQKLFIEHIGFRPVGVLKRPSGMHPKDLQNLLKLEPELIVGNLQSNATAARRLGQRMEKPVAVLTNFPAGTGNKHNYEQMVLDNLKALKEAWNQR